MKEGDEASSAPLTFDFKCKPPVDYSLSPSSLDAFLKNGDILDS